MNGTIGDENKTRQEIEKNYKRKVVFAEDRMKIVIK